MKEKKCTGFVKGERGFMTFLQRGLENNMPFMIKFTKITLCLRKEM